MCAYVYACMLASACWCACMRTHARERMRVHALRIHGQQDIDQERPHDTYMYTHTHSLSLSVSLSLCLSLCLSLSLIHQYLSNQPPFPGPLRRRAGLCICHAAHSLVPARTCTAALERRGSSVRGGGLFVRVARRGRGGRGVLSCGVLGLGLAASGAAAAALRARARSRAGVALGTCVRARMCMHALRHNPGMSTGGQCVRACVRACVRDGALVAWSCQRALARR